MGDQREDVDARAMARVIIELARKWLAARTGTDRADDMEDGRPPAAMPLSAMEELA